MIEFAVRRPVAIIMICIGLTVLGLIAMQRIPMQLLPNIVSPEFTIVTELKGSTPEEIETLVTIPIERAVSTVGGLYRSVSHSERERSEVRLSFSSRVDFLETASQIRDRLDGIGLPEGTSRPKILRFQSNGTPIIRLALKPKDSGLTTLELSRIVEDTLLRKLEAVEGVALASLYGAPTKEIEITANPTALLSYSIPITAIPEAISNANKSLAGGEIEYNGSRTSVRMGQSLRGVEELKNVTVKRQEDKFLRLLDVASVKEVIRPPRIRTHLQNEASLVIEVRKEAEANSVTVAENAKKVIEKFLSDNSERVEGSILINLGTQIHTAIEHVTDTVIHGGMLAAIVIFLLLQAAWPTFVVSVSMPLSLLVTLILMYFTGVSFNLMSLAGLALGVGMLVDNSTIVLDSINKTSLNQSDKREAALWGARSVAGAITASTLSTMAVFGPLAFVEGMIGQMFRDVAATVCYAMLASLFVAVIVIPMLSALDLKFQKSEAKPFSLEDFVRQFRFGSFYQGAVHNYFADFMKKNLLVLRASFSIIGQFLIQLGQFAFGKMSARFAEAAEAIVNPFLAKISKALHSLESFMRRTIPAIIKDSRRTVVWTIAITLGGVFIIAQRGGELFPDEASDLLNYEIEFMPGQSLDTTEQKVREIEAQLLKVDRIEYVSSSVGERGGNYAKIVLKVPPKESLDLVKEVNEVLGHVPGISFTRAKDALIGEGKPVQIEVYNEDLNQLKAQVQKVKSIVSGVDGLIDVSADVKPDVSEINITFDKNRLSALEIDPSVFTGPLKAMLSGQSAGTLRVGAEELPVSVVIPEEYFNSVDKVRYLATTQNDSRVYLEQISNVSEDRVIGAIHRVNRKRMATVSANLYKTDLGTASAKVQQKLKSETGINWKMGGQDEERERSQKSLLMAVLLSVFLIYLMLAGQFENLIQPAIILSAVPLCLSGVAVFLILFGLNMSALVFVGFIILVGSSVNTSIVMVDFANQLVVEGKTIRDAISEATVRRMRPILVTTASNVFGHLPMALALGQGAGMQQPLAVTLIGGLLSSTVLTMLIVPILYSRLTKGTTHAHG